MAGIKISALPAGSIVADNDLIPYVDVSDTSESATGTTKYMEKSLLVIPTSGTWTPVISGVVGAATVTIPSGPSYYTQVGDIVTETFHVNIAMDTLQTSETFNVSTAILRATNFTDDKAIRGTWSVFGPSVASVAFVQIESESSTKLIAVRVDSIANADVTLQLNHQYSLV